MVKIKKNILKKLEKRSEESGSFKNVDEYVNYILQQIVDRLDKEKSLEKPAYSEEDEEKVKKTLRKLGYIK